MTSPLRLTFTSSQDDLQSMIRQFLSTRFPEERVRAIAEGCEELTRADWAEFADLGLLGVSIPAEYGGEGHMPVEASIISEELGRALTPLPYFSTITLAVGCLLASGDQSAQERYLPAIAAGTLTATIAVQESDSAWSADSITTTALLDGERWQLSGTKSFVLDGTRADLILVVAHGPEGPTLFAVNSSAGGVTTTAMTVVDQTRPLAQITFTNTPAELVGVGGSAWDTITETLRGAWLALALEQLGGARRCLEMTVDYVKTRQQFGQPIGTFQAVKHKCTDMLADVERTTSAAYNAVWSTAEDDAARHLEVATAAACANESFKRVSGETIHLHGGIGFTWEHSAHLYYRRAYASATLLGNLPLFQEQIAVAAGL